MISQIMRNQNNTIKSGGELAMKIMTDHREVNPLCRTWNHKYKTKKTIHLIKVGNMP